MTKRYMNPATQEVLAEMVKDYKAQRAKKTDMLPESINTLSTKSKSK